MADSETTIKVLEQLCLIYGPDNMETDTFFREMTMQDPEGWITLKKLSNIKRFKAIINGDTSFFEAAATLSEGVFEMNKDKTKLRMVKGPELTPEEIEEAEKVEKEAKEAEVQAEHVKKLTETMSTQNSRSIYAKGFSVDPETSKEDIRAYFTTFGRVVTVKLRLNEEKKFKGSVFIEFETPEVAASVAKENLTFADQELNAMLKQDYIDMKCKEKFEGKDWAPVGINKKLANLIEYSGGNSLSFKEIKTMIAPYANAPYLEPLGPAANGCGVIEIMDMTPEQFFNAIENNAIGPLTFRLPDDKAREIYTMKRKEAREALRSGRGRRGRGGHGDRGGRGRGGRGGRGGREGFHGKENSNKRSDDGKVSDPKRSRTVEVVASGIPSVGSSTSTAPKK
ncbi:hypothetical protein BDF14DRAFT_1841353 [Spinellus fusiger]|nr:hypothetical protein BDF14DRAFT_1841353 [Spinellus fusiger]